MENNTYICVAKVFFIGSTDLAAPVVKCGRFFVSLRISHFGADFRPLNGLGGTSYHLRAINASNRIFGQFYFFVAKTEKIKEKVLVIKNKLLPLHRG